MSRSSRGGPYRKRLQVEAYEARDAAGRCEGGYITRQTLRESSHLHKSQEENIRMFDEELEGLFEIAEHIVAEGTPRTW